MNFITRSNQTFKQILATLSRSEKRQTTTIKSDLKPFLSHLSYIYSRYYKTSLPTSEELFNRIRYSKKWKEGFTSFYYNTQLADELEISFERKNREYRIIIMDEKIYIETWNIFTDELLNTKQLPYKIQDTPIILLGTDTSK
jgi:anti-sigma regulatory factor (Ser/Thr protein kinase)